MSELKELRIHGALGCLLKKYNIVPGLKLSVAGEDEYIADGLNVDVGYNLIGKEKLNSIVPLLCWRTRRSFIELKNILNTHTLVNPCLIRFSSIADKTAWTLESLLYRETDLLEYITGHSIIAVAALLSKDSIANVIVNLDNGILCSIEISLQLPVGKDPIERHEIIAQKGTASDMVVDTQIMQQSVYLFTKDREEQFTDYDMELFGFNHYQIDFVRSAFQIIQDSALAESWCSQHQHLSQVIKAIYLANSQRKKIKL